MSFLVDITMNSRYIQLFQRIFLVLLLKISVRITIEAKITENPLSTYDYIIVGGGTSGAVLAKRLSADRNIHVLVLEAGKEPHKMVDMPFFSAFLQQSELDWIYRTVPQKTSGFQLRNRSIIIPRGKVLGGSSVINYMIYSRGTKKDYDKWSENGAIGWSWDEVFPYFKKTENNKDPFIAYNGYHGTEGEMSMQKTNYYTPLAQAYVEAAKELGYKQGDCNGKHPDRFMILQGFINDGRRWSTYDGFFDPLRYKNNMDVVTGAFVTKILFDAHKRATGVQFDYNNKTKTVSARYEVILSAGAIGSPQLLMLSGIGPKEHLQSLGIPVISDLSVGQNLQEHVNTGVPFSIVPQITLQLFKVALLGMLPFYVRKGPLTSIGVEAIGFFNSKYNNDTDWPDIELTFASYTPSSDGGVVSRNMYAMTDELWEKVFKPYVDKESYFCMPLLMHPLSRGEIKLASTNPYDYPIIDPKYYSVKQDLTVLVEGVKKCFEFASTSVMKNFGARPFDVVMPGCEQYKLHSDAYFTCWLQSYTVPNQHSSGTCKMGDPADPTTVVDPQLRVKGVSRLRVIDASIIPTLVTGHTEAPALMIGEKGSDMVLSDYYWNSRNI